MVATAILRYRLWDIDVTIRKMLVYGVLTAPLALVYFGAVVLLPRLVGTLTGVEQSPLTVAVSTLAIVVLFTPRRRRIQAIIDRRFFHKKYDAHLVRPHLAVTVRNETGLDALAADLARVVQESLQPEGVSVVAGNEKPGWQISSASRDAGALPVGLSGQGIDTAEPGVDHMFGRFSSDLDARRPNDGWKHETSVVVVVGYLN